MNILGTASVCLGAIRVIQNIINKHDTETMNALEDNPAIDLFEVRKQLQFLQETLNNEMPIQPEEETQFVKNITALKCATVTENTMTPVIASIVSTIKTITLIKPNIEEAINNGYWYSESSATEPPVAVMNKLCTTIIYPILNIIVREYRGILYENSTDDIACALGHCIKYALGHSKIIDEATINVLCYIAVVFTKHELKESGDINV